MKNSPVHAFIFDMDGVIVHSNPVHREAWRDYGSRHGIEIDEAMEQRMYGRRNDEIVRDFFGPSLSDEETFAHGAAKERLYREMIAPVIAQSLVPGLREFLLKHRDVPAAMATNAEEANVSFILEAAKLGEMFRAVVDGHQVRNPKPHPDIYLRAAELLRIQPEHCLVFEDSYTGVEAARAAGMPVIALRTTHAEFQGVALSIDDFASPELEKWLEGRIAAR